MSLEDMERTFKPSDLRLLFIASEFMSAVAEDAKDVDERIAAYQSLNRSEKRQAAAILEKFDAMATHDSVLADAVGV